MATRSLGTSDEYAGLRDAVALVIAFRAGDRASACELLALRQGADFALIEALAGIVEAFGIDCAACRGLTFDELLRRVSLRLAAMPDTGRNRVS